MEVTFVYDKIHTRLQLFLLKGLFEIHLGLCANMFMNLNDIN